MASINPLQYRGHYYDKESGLYYLQSRYYDPVVKRFINADSSNLITVNPYGLTDKNLFSYCDNNPTGRKDENGDAWVACALIGAAVGLTTQYVSDVWDNYRSGVRGSSMFTPTSSGTEYLSAGVSGAIAAIPGFGGLGSALVSGAAGNVAGNWINGNIKSVSDVRDCALSGAVANGLGYGAAKLLARIKVGKINAMNRSSKKQYLQEVFYKNKHRYTNMNLYKFRDNPVKQVMSRYGVFRYGVFSTITSTVALSTR